MPQLPVMAAKSKEFAKKGSEAYAKAYVGKRARLGRLFK
jgi:hypothetical protein